MRGGGGGREGERESQAGSRLCIEPHTGLDAMTQRSGPKSVSRVTHLAE